MDTPKEEYYIKMLETLFNYNDRNNGPLSTKSFQQAVSRFMAEMEEEEHDGKRNANNVTMDTISPLHHSITTRRDYKRDKCPFHHFTISRRDYKRDKREANFFGNYGRNDILI